jgi:glutamate-1-semialdehyde 2,1-aminomutase
MFRHTVTVHTAADPGLLSPAERNTLAVLCGGNPRLWGTVAMVMRQQPGSVLLNQRAGEVVSGLPSQVPYTATVLPLCVDSAGGAHVRDVDGNSYVDCHMGYTASILGHSPPPVVDAVAGAVRGGTGAGHFVRPQVELGEQVLRFVPWAERVAFFHSGAEAVAACVRMARAVTGRHLVAKFEGCYHGSGEVGLYNTTITLSGQTPRGPVEDITPVACTGGVSRAAGAELLVLPFDDDAALRLVARRADELACVVVDPVPPFRASAPEASAGFLTALREVTARHGIALVFDEVVSGFRLARGGAQEAFSVTADLACYGKITSGLGLPLTVVAGSAAYLDSASTGGMLADFGGGKVWVSTTNAANHLSVVAALAQLRHLWQSYDEVMATLDRNHAALAQRLAVLRREDGLPVYLHGHPRLQSMIAFGDAGPPVDYRTWLTHAGPDRLRAPRLLTLYLRLHGVYTKSNPTMNLSAAHTAHDVDTIADAVAASAAAMARQGVLPEREGVP